MILILNIAIVGYNHDLSRRALWEIVNNDVNSKFAVRNKDSVTMEDGTKYRAISREEQVRGYSIDQLIIVDDLRWEIYNKQKDVIEYIKYRLEISCVPEEFQVQQYEW